MPLYEYECESCGSRFERIQKFSDPPIAVCPKCDGPVRKLLSSPAIQFKGSGFYITDYPKAGNADKSGAAPAGKSGSDKSSDKSSDKTESSSTSTEKTTTSSDSAKSSESKSTDSPAKPAKTSSE